MSPLFGVECVSEKNHHKMCQNKKYHKGGDTYDDVLINLTCNDYQLHHMYRTPLDLRRRERMEARFRYVAPQKEIHQRADSSRHYHRIVRSLRKHRRKRTYGINQETAALPQAAVFFLMYLKQINIPYTYHLFL